MVVVLPEQVAQSHSLVERQLELKPVVLFLYFRVVLVVRNRVLSKYHLVAQHKVAVVISHSKLEMHKIFLGQLKLLLGQVPLQQEVLLLLHRVQVHNRPVGRYLLALARLVLVQVDQYF